MPEWIGAYRVLSLLGRGGMGEVYLAEQREPIRRKVALKLIKVGMDTKQVIARFESERQALALMNHPNIAKVFDAGSTENGRPYFAMEYVEGIPITSYCDSHRLSTTERLNLLIDVCDGVQHAHQKGIIHRDIKPSNVLVTVEHDRPVPKIIDFGVAKATEQRLTEKTVFTRIGALIGTPEYMSPEQAEMTSLDVDTRTDVYSMGVMLYELLTGQLPFDSARLREAGFDEMRRWIREEEPSRPSTRLSDADGPSLESARRRRSTPRLLVRELRGDLDWITMRALEKDRTRRYGSPSDLAADIGRHLNHEPVAAGPPGMGYRVGKFVRRHTIGVLFAGVLLALILGFGAVMAVQAARIASERDRANQEAETARQVSDFLVGLFRVADPTEARGSEITAREVMDRGADRVKEDLAEEPIVQARMLQAMGNVYFHLGLYQDARELLESSLRIQRESLGELAPDTVESAQQLVAVLWEMGEREDSLEIARSTLAALQDTRTPNDPQLLSAKRNLGLSYGEAGRYEEAEAMMLDALRGFRSVEGDSGMETLVTQNNLALLYQALGRFDEAIELSIDTLEKRRELLGDDHPHTLDVLSNLAISNQNAGRPREAEPFLLEAFEGSRRVLGPDHPRTLGTQNNLAVLYRDLGRLDEAERLLADMVDVCRKQLGDEHPNTLMTLGNLGEVYTLQLRYEEAEQYLNEAVEGLRRAIPGAHLVKGLTIRKLGACLTGQERFDEAQSALLEAHTMLEETVGADHPQTLKVVGNLVELYDAWGKTGESASWRDRLPSDAATGDGA